MSGKHAVTGAFGYSGKRIAQRLLNEGREVITLTNSLKRPDPFNGAVAAHRLAFEDEAALAKTLEGVETLYNTYWVRFDHRDFTFAEAVDNSRRLFRAAKQAGVKRIVHVSITNPSPDSPLKYFRGKAEVERALAETGAPHSILRPAVLFGGEDILINNIAWGLRRFPVTPIFGDGEYKLQPIHVEDFAELAAAEGTAGGVRMVNAIGPETYTYRELLQMIGEAIGKVRPTMRIPAPLGYALAWVTGVIVGDVMLTREEIEGLMAGFLYVDDAPAGHTRLSEWVRENADTLGRRYASELARRQHRDASYTDL